MRIYPPLFFQRIWLVNFDKGFRGAKISVRKSIWNRNYNNSIFGGTIFAAADAFYPILYYKIFTAKGYNIRAWSKSVNIKYNKPAFKQISYKLYVNDADIAEAEDILNTVGKYVKAHPIEIYDVNGINVSSVIIEIYMRNLDFIDTWHANNNE